MFRSIHEPRTRAREYSDFAVNIYTGCNHCCIYCYAPSVLHKRKSEFEQVQPYENIVDTVKAQLSRKDYTGKKIMLCYTCDPYPADVDTLATRKIIKAIKEAGAYVQILTKGGNRAKREIGKLNYMPSDINWGKFGRECERLCKEYHRDYYIKEDLKKEMEK